ncbi:MAG: hypothetical protein ACRDJP_01480 [Actinomycetota bacterium]
MPGPNRGALPLALLIVATLAAGIVVAVMQLDEQDKDKAGPVVPSPEPTIPSPEPTTPASPESPISPEPTDESPSPKPTTESPTPEPSPTDDGGGGGRNGDDDDVLAQTGGPILPYFLGGALMLAGSAGLWRLRRLFD